MARPRKKKAAAKKSAPKKSAAALRRELAAARERLSRAAKKVAEQKKEAAAQKRKLSAQKKKLAAQAEKISRQRKINKARAKKRTKRGEPELRGAVERKYRGTKLGTVTHVSARESEGEPQYAWKELEEKIYPKLKRRKKSVKTKRWARLVVEFSRSSLLFPKEYKKLRGTPVIRTGWYQAHEFLGKAVGIVDKLQESGAVTPRMKVTFVERAKKPGSRLF